MVPQISLTEKQMLAYELLESDFISFLLFGGAAGGAKSWLGCVWLLINCYKYPGSKWFIGRKERTRLMSSTYQTWMKVCSFYSIPKTDWRLNGQYNYIEFIDGRAKGSRIDLLDLAPQPADPLYERFGSLEYTGGWIEEAGEVEFACFDVLKTRVGRHMNNVEGLKRPKLLLTCNPTKNWLYRIFYKPYKNNTLPSDYAFIRSLHGDNPFNSAYYSEQLDKITDPIQRARLRDGYWEYTDDDLLLIHYDAIVEMFTNPIEESYVGYLSADIARFGSDKIVLGVWKGYDLQRVVEKAKQSQLQTEQDIRDELVKAGIPYNRAIIDEDGIGGGVVDHLVGSQGFMGNRSPIVKPSEEDEKTGYSNLPLAYTKRQNFRNLRSQCYFRLAEKINAHEVKISAQITDLQKEYIIDELQQIRRLDVNPDAPLQIVPKDEMKDALGRSPDYADMLMMRTYFDLIKEESMPKYNPPRIDVIRQSGAVSDYGGVPFAI